jgi:hypothetical protein
VKNIDLNPGGLIGALACGGITAAVVFSSIDAADTGRGPYKFIIFALIGGAFAGNFLWGLVFKKPAQGPRSFSRDQPASGPSVAPDPSARAEAGHGRRRSEDDDHDETHEGQRRSGQR